MAGTTLDRELTLARSKRLEFALATQADDSDIRRLLRENAMRGQISLTLEREPNYFTDAHWPGTEKQTVIAREEGRVACVGNCVLRDRFVNGKSRRVGYLGGLRLDAQSAGRFDILRRGYEFFRELQTGRPADFYFTSIASDNLPARKFLERGLPGMPTYEFVTEFVTALLPIGRHGAAVQTPLKAEPVEFTEAFNYLQQRGAAYQFAESWTEPEVQALCKLGLRSEHPFCVRENGRIIATAAIWDQRSFKQTVIQGYSPHLAATRPAVNFLARLLNLPELPPVGATLANAFVSHLAVEPQHPEAFTCLVAAARNSLVGQGIAFLTLGFASNDPNLAMLRNAFRCREYVTRIYVVHWPGTGTSKHELDGRCVGLEAALL